jgi:hypothetical protein
LLGSLAIPGITTTANPNSKPDTKAQSTIANTSAKTKNSDSIFNP